MRTRPARPPLRKLLLAAACGLSALGAERAALAQSFDGEAERIAAAAINEDYAAGKAARAQKKLEKAIAKCKKGECSSRVLGRLYRDLGVVFAGGLGKPKQAKQAFERALEADPKLTLDADFTTPEIAQAFRDAGGKLPAEKDTASAADTGEQEQVVLEETPAPEAADDGGTEARKTWFSLGAQQDILLHSATNPVCYGPDYTCFGPGGGEYVGPVYGGGGNQSAGGFTLATTRLLLGVERVFGSNLVLGVRAGFAFRGGPTSKAGAKFLPVHAELRGAYVFGDNPFANTGFRPYLALGGGLAEVDGKLRLEYFPDKAAYDAGQTSSVDAWRRTGRAFVAPTLGTQIAFARGSAITLEVRLMVMLGAYGLAPAAGIAYAHGL